METKPKNHQKAPGRSPLPAGKTGLPHRIRLNDERWEKLNKSWPELAGKTIRVNLASV